MKASELRIGNIVNMKVPSGKFIDGNPEMVDFSIDIDSRQIHTLDYFGEGIISAIVISDEWLLRFGFEKGQDTFFLGGFELDIVDGGFIYNDLSYKVSLPFVHKLQNLYFALTGEELKCK